MFLWAQYPCMVGESSLLPSGGACTAVFLSIKVHQLPCQDCYTNMRLPLEPFSPEAGPSRTWSSQRDAGGWCLLDCGGGCRAVE